MPSSAKIVVILSGLWLSSQISQYSAFNCLIASRSSIRVIRFSSSARSIVRTPLHLLFTPNHLSRQHAHMALAFVQHLAIDDSVLNAFGSRDEPTSAAW